MRRWTLPADRSSRLAALSRIASAVVLVIGIAGMLRVPVPAEADSALLAVVVLLFLVAAVAAWRTARGPARAVYAGVAMAALIGAVAQAWDTIVYIIPHAVVPFPSRPLLLVIFGVHPAIIAGLLGAMARGRRRMDRSAAIDTLLLIAAAAVIAIELAYVLPWPGATLTPSGRLVLDIWRALTLVELLLAAVVIVTVGHHLGMRVSAGLGLGTLSLAVTNAVHGQLSLRAVDVATVPDDTLWVLSLFLFAIAFPAPAAEAGSALESAEARSELVRAGAIVVAMLISASSALVLGLRAEQEPALATAVAVFGVILAARAGQALLDQWRHTRTLEHSVLAERELSATLEHRVTERTRELAAAQRVLQRMWTLGQQITLELHPARVLERFMEAVVDVVEADAGAVALMADDGKMRIVAAAGSADPLVGQTVPIASSALGRVMRTGQPWLSEDVLTEPEARANPAPNEMLDRPLRGLAIVPLQRRGERIGAVGIASLRPRRFTPTEVERVEAMADLLSVALANAELVETLRQAEWRFRTLFRAAPDAVLSVFQSGRIREANDAVREITGLDPVQLVGRMLGDLVSPEDRAPLDEMLARAFDGAPARLEVRMVVREAPRVVALAASRLPEADPPSILIIGRDITAEREMRARLMETDRLAAVGELVAGVAHEVNNPLSSISAFAQLLLRDGDLTASQRDSVEVIRSETLRASQVVKDLLAFARRSEPQREPIDLNQVVERTLRLRGYQLSASQVRVELQLAPDLPAVIGDARQLQQVALNLITNAIQAMAPQGSGTLTLRTRDLGEHAALEVEDTGHGIPAAARARIFEPFFTTKREGEGTGLGLSVSYGIVSAHGGTIDVVRTSPQGTTFAVTLPAAGRPADLITSGEHAVLPARSPLAGLRLLFVDDEAALRSGMEAFGRLRGFGVITAAGGEEALVALQQMSFDAVVCDLRMPGMDGLAFHEALRRERPGLATRTVFITGDVMHASGATRVPYAVARQPTINKPFSFEVLEDALVAVLRGIPFSLPTERPAGAH